MKTSDLLIGILAIWAGGLAYHLYTKRRHVGERPTVGVVNGTGHAAGQFMLRKSLHQAKEGGSQRLLLNDFLILIYLC